MRYSIALLLNLALASTTFAQTIPDIDPELTWNRSWIETSHGPSVTKNGYFIYGPSIAYSWLTSKDKLVKVKFAWHKGGYAESQTAMQFSLMRAEIQKSPGASFEFHYGLGLITGLKYGERVPEYWLTDREQFFSVGIPLELRVQFFEWGFGLDGNLNLHTPYIGLKLFSRFGVLASPY